MQYLGCLFFVLIGVFLIIIIGILLAIQKILQTLGINLPWFKFIKTESNYSRNNDSQENENTTKNRTIYSSKEIIEKKKVFTEEDGEYVEFEEIREDNSTSDTI